jgi:hypothetical protein
MVMSTSVNSAMHSSIKKRDTFLARYAADYPDNSVESGKELYVKLMNIIYECKYLADEYKYAIDFSSGDSSLGLRLVYWLFHDSDFIDNPSKLISFIVEKNDISLQYTDYALLFYISLQSAEVQDAARGLPLSLLYDMFLPVAEDKLNRWKVAKP